MKKLFLLISLPFLIKSQTVSGKIRVLFLGNSYTYVNNLPQLVHDLAISLGDSLEFDSYCPGGYTFNNHAGDPNTLSKISAGNWNYVVLQAQSQEPSFSPGQVAAQTLPYAIKLDSMIKHYNPCAYTVFYETWGRKNGDASNCPFYPPVCTYSGMQGRLRDSYRLFADTVHGIMAPVGEAWRLARSTNTAINFYQADESHPLLEGSYLAAAVFYETLFRKSVLSSTYTPGIASSTVTMLNQVAHQLVSDSALITNIPKYIPTASFTASAQTNTTFQFTSGTPGFQHFWNFGDGSTSGVENPVHTFTTSGNYTVALLIKNSSNCVIDSVTETIQVSITTGISEKNQETIRLYPNPCYTELIIKAGEIFKENYAKITITNYLGQIVECVDYEERLNVSLLRKGVYFIKVSNHFAEVNSCFIKNE